MLIKGETHQNEIIIINLYLPNVRHEHQWNRIDVLDMNPHSYAHLIFDKGAKSIRWRKSASSTNVAGKSGYLPAKN
jgi:hypothetical protein